MLLVGIIVAIVIFLQVLSFWKNLKRMGIFSRIFEETSSWGIQTSNYGQTVAGIRGKGNSVFYQIKDSINDYLGNSQGSVIDYNILKDSVDRNCESVEDEINAQMPVPLYCGLAGTMAGVIVGLFSLLFEDSISNLMVSGGKSVQAASVAMDGAANGINDLLAGVAMAMIASILGIILTTTNSILFKRFKRQEEVGKNKFLSWMQSVLLPKLPNDISDAFSRLVANLNKFNGTFKENTQGLGRTLSKINEAYSIQADIVESIQKMDVAKMATANVKVLKALNESTEKLEQFNYYLNSIKGYTMEIESFRKQLNSEDDMVYLLIEMKGTLQGIKDFFKEELGEINSRKAAIGKSIDNVDTYITGALDKLNKTSVSSVDGLKMQIDHQADELEKFLEQEKQMLQDMSQEVRIEFEKQISQVPNISKRLEDITKLPAQLEQLSNSIAESNKKLVNGITQANQNMTNDIKHVLKKMEYSASDSGNGGTTKVVMPMWMKVAIITLLFVIAGATAANTWITYSSNQDKNVQHQSETATDVQTTDSIDVKDTSPIKQQIEVEEQQHMNMKADSIFRQSAKQSAMHKLK